MSSLQTNSFSSFDPATNEQIGTFAVMGQIDADSAVQQAREAASHWAVMTAPRRCAPLQRLHAALAAHAAALTAMLCRETGKPIQDAYGAELIPILSALEWLIRRAPGHLSRQAIQGVRHASRAPQPYGVIGVIGTWNYPLFLDLCPIAWALAAGNTVVWKPSELATATATIIHDRLQEAGLPVRLLTGDGGTGRALCRAGIDKLVFTGGISTGRSILAQLAEFGTPSVMELSGNDAMIVCPDADVSLAARSAAWGRCCNAGQSCVAPQRIYVAHEIVEPFLRECERVMDHLVAGRDFGPLRTPGLRERAHLLVQDAVKAGACLRRGGTFLPDQPGNWYRPTLLSACRDGMAVMAEDFFGPVLPICAVASEREAIERTDANRMALGASIWTRNLRRGREIAEDLRVGVAAVNTDTLLLAADPRLPFGGMAASGFGMQHGAAGLNEFVQWKTVAVSGTGGTRRHLFPYRSATLPILRGTVQFRSARTLAAKWYAVRSLIRAVKEYKNEETKKMQIGEKE